MDNNVIRNPPNSLNEKAYIPPVSRPAERAAAESRRRSFPYTFPRDSRHVGGKFSVEANGRRLMRFFYFERRLAQALGSWTLAIPELEVKIETGRHIFWHADAAKRLRERLTEQETAQDDVDGFRDADIDMVIDELLTAENTPELLIGVHRVVGRALQAEYRHHIEQTCPIADAPTIRILKQILMDYDPMLDWAEQAIEAYVEGGLDSSRLEVWRWHLSLLLSSIGGVTGVELRGAPPAPLRSVEHPYQRGQVPKRDSRFATFCNTGDYHVADGAPRYIDQAYEEERLCFVRTQRDEVDAIEAFGTFLWDVRFRDFQAEYDLARVTWDEARHTELGHRTLLIMGYDPFELPNRLTPSTCRGPMAVEFAMAEINLFGEVGVLKTINRLIDQARARGDSAVEHACDFVRADERTHVRKGQRILTCMTSMKMKVLEQRTREVFTECLVGLGVFQKEPNGVPLSREEIEHHVGE